MFTNARFISMLAIGGSLGLVGLGCAVEERSCPRVAGEFAALYTPVQTSCQPLATVYTVPFDSGRHGVQESNKDFGYQIVKTEVEATGCTVRMTQSVIKDAPAGSGGAPLLEQRIRGEALTIDGKDRVTGMVEMIRYDEMQQVTCSGMYDATFTQKAATSSSTAGSTLGN